MDFYTVSRQMHKWAKTNTRKGSKVVVLCEVGDFFEAFDDDAPIVAEVCGVMLTTRGTGRVPMAGFIANLSGEYIAKLVRAGYTVLVAGPESAREEV